MPLSESKQTLLRNLANGVTLFANTRKSDSAPFAHLKTLRSLEKEGLLVFSREANQTTASLTEKGVVVAANLRAPVLVAVDSAAMPSDMVIETAEVAE
jgi:hypothetical protein